MVKEKIHFPSLFTTIILVFLSLSTFAQTKSKDTIVVEKDSVNVVIGKQVSTLSGVTGFMKQSNDKWATALNKIPFYEPDYNNAYYEKYKIGSENFQQLSFYEVTVDSVPYYLFLNRYLKGYYKDEETKEEFKTYYAAEYYFVSRKDLHQSFPDTVKFNKAHTIMLRTYYSGYIPLGKMIDLQKKVNWDVNHNLKTAHLYDTSVKAFYCFITYPVKTKSGGKYVRFNTALAYAQSGKRPTEPSSDMLKSQYYQTTYDKFKLFIRGKH